MPLPKPKKSYKITPVKTLMCGVPVDMISVPRRQNHVSRRPHLSGPLQAHEEEMQQPQDRGTNIDLLHISGLSGDGESTLIITVLLLSLGSAGLFLLSRCIKDCNQGSNDEHNLWKTQIYEQLFSTLLDKQEKEL